MKVISLLAGVLVLGGAAHAADLQQIYREALSSDQQFAAARAAVAAAREKEPQGLAGLLPEISASANTTWNDNTVEFPGIDEEGARQKRKFNSNGYSVALTQPLFNWQNIVTYSQSKLQVAQAEAQFAQARQELILRVAQAYLDVLAGEEVLRASQAQKTAIAEQLRQAKKMYEVGTVIITDSLEAESRFELALSQEIAAESDLEFKRDVLRSIIEKDPGTLAKLKPSVVLNPPQPAEIDKWVEAAKTGNFIVQAQEAAAEVAAKQVERNRAGHYPVVEIVGNAGRSNNSVFSTPGGGGFLGVKQETDFSNVGIQVTLPLFAGGRVNSLTREAAANRENAIAQLGTARRNAVVGSRQSYLAVVNGLAQIGALRAAVVASQASLKSNKLGYEGGVRTNIDVLNAEQQVFASRRDLARAYLDTLMGQLRLKSTVGSLSETDIQEINALLEVGQ